LWHVEALKNIAHGKWPPTLQKVLPSEPGNPLGWMVFGPCLLFDILGILLCGLSSNDWENHGKGILIVRKEEGFIYYGLSISNRIP
jgi:hypothetical protein